MSKKSKQLSDYALTRRRFMRLTAGVCATGTFSFLFGCANQEEDASQGAGQTQSSARVKDDSVGVQTSKEDAASSAAITPTDAPHYEQLSTTLFYFDTVITLLASCSQETMDAASERCAYFESIFSRTIDTSDIGRINAAQGKPVVVAKETADIITKALDYCRESDGAFDITIGAASSLWDFKEGIVPNSDELARAVSHIDYSCVQVQGTTVTLTDPEAKLDLGGIAKGYIADDLCNLFQEAGCTSGYVNLGGNVKTIGLKPDGTSWHVGIQDPNDEEGSVTAAVYAQQEGTSVVTSGLYERQFTVGGQHYWHILDPKTGYPVQTDLVSATIISSASIDGDGLTKPLFMMGHDKALAWINQQEGIEGLVVDIVGTISQSDGCDAELM